VFEFAERSSHDILPEEDDPKTSSLSIYFKKAPQSDYDDDDRLESMLTGEVGDSQVYGGDSHTAEESSL